MKIKAEQETLIVNNNLNKVNKFRLTILMLYVLKQSYAQSNYNPLIIGDSLLSTYISNSLDTVSVDSCFVGIYYFKFSLLANGDVKGLAYSGLIPDQFKKVIEQKLTDLKANWNVQFLKYVSTTEKLILQPIFFQIDAQCATKENFYTKKLNPDSANYSCDIANAIVLIQAEFLRNIDSTFQEGFKFNPGKGYVDCLLMRPCFIEGYKVKPRKK